MLDAPRLQGALAMASIAVGYGTLVSALTEPVLFSLLGRRFSQKGRKAVGYGHRDKEVTRQQPRLRGAAVASDR